MSSYTYLVYHIVFSTKDREPLIMPEYKERLYQYMGGIIRAERGNCIEAGGIEDHVHLLVRSRASISVSDLVQRIKGKSSKWVSENLRTPKAFYWQEGYGAFTVSKSQVEKVRNYICNQEAHHRKQRFQDEFIGLLEKHEVEYDPRYLWE